MKFTLAKATAIIDGKTKYVTGNLPGHVSEEEMCRGMAARPGVTSITLTMFKHLDTRELEEILRDDRDRRP
jgi:hypothetical protein